MYKSKNKVHVLYVINSMINKPGNIGLRIGKIPQVNSGIIYRCLARGGTSDKYEAFYTMGIFGHINRMLAFIRRRFLTSFKHRVYDKMLFEFFYFHSINKITREGDSKKVAHLVEFSPAIIKDLKSKGYVVLLDVPIGPSNYMINLINKYGEELKDIGAYYMKDFEQESFNMADHILVPSKFVYNELIKLGVDRTKITTVPFGVDLKNKYQVKKEQKESTDFVFAGVLSTRKGIKYLLDAWSSDEFKKDRLHLCGKVTPEVKALLSDYKFENVLLPGFVDTKEYFKKCDIYVFPSLLEGSSKSIYEAINANLPVITTFESGSIVRDGENGIIVPICDAEKLRDSMIELKSNIELQNKIAAKAHASLKEYTWDNYSKNINNIYGKLS